MEGAAPPGFRPVGGKEDQEGSAGPIGSSFAPLSLQFPVSPSIWSETTSSASLGMPPGSPPQPGMGQTTQAAAPEGGDAFARSGSSDRTPAPRPPFECDGDPPPSTSPGHPPPDRSAGPSHPSPVSRFGTRPAPPDSPSASGVSTSHPPPSPASRETLEPRRATAANVASASAALNPSGASPPGVFPPDGSRGGAGDLPSEDSRVGQALPSLNSASSGAEPAAGREAGCSPRPAGGQADASNDRSRPGASEIPQGARPPPARQAGPHPAPKVAAALRKLGVSELPQISSDLADGGGEAGRSGRGERRQRRTQMHAKGLFKRLQDGVRGREAEASHTASGGAQNERERGDAKKASGCQGRSAQKNEAPRKSPGASARTASGQWMARPGASPWDRTAGAHLAGQQGGAPGAVAAGLSAGPLPTAGFPLGAPNTATSVGGFAEQASNVSYPLPVGAASAGPRYPSEVYGGVATPSRQGGDGQRNPTKGAPDSQRRKNAGGGPEGGDRWGDGRQPPLPGQGVDAGFAGDGGRSPLEAPPTSIVRDLWIEQFGPADGEEKTAEQAMAMSAWRVTWVDGTWKVHTATFEPKPTRDPYPLAATEACTNFALRLYRAFRETYTHTQQGAGAPPRLPALGHLLGCGAGRGAFPGGPADGLKAKMWSVEELQRLHQHVTTAAFAALGSGAMGGSEMTGLGGQQPPRDRPFGAFLHLPNASPGGGGAVDGAVDLRAGPVNQSSSSVSSAAPSSKTAFSPSQPTSHPGGFSSANAKFPLPGAGQNSGVPDSRGFGGLHAFAGTPARAPGRQGIQEHTAYACKPPSHVTALASGQALPVSGGGVFPAVGLPSDGGFQSHFYSSFPMSGDAGGLQRSAPPFLSGGSSGDEQAQGHQLPGELRSMDSNPWLLPAGDTSIPPGSRSSASSADTSAPSLPPSLVGTLDDAGGASGLHAFDKGGKRAESPFPPCPRVRRGAAVSVSGTPRGGPPPWGVNSHVAAALSAAAAKRTAEEQSLLEEARRDAEREALLSKLLGEDDDACGQSALSMRAHRLLIAAPKLGDGGGRFEEKVTRGREAKDQKADVTVGEEGDAREERSVASRHLAATRDRTRERLEDIERTSDWGLPPGENARAAPTGRIKREGRQRVDGGESAGDERHQADKTAESGVGLSRGGVRRDAGEETERSRSPRQRSVFRGMAAEQTDTRRKALCSLESSRDENSCGDENGQGGLRAPAAGMQAEGEGGAAGEDAPSVAADQAETSRISVPPAAGEGEATETTFREAQRPETFVFEPGNTGLILVELSEQEEGSDATEDDALDGSPSACLAGVLGDTDGTSPEGDELLPWESPDKTRLLLESVSHRAAELSETASEAFGADQSARDASLLRDLEPFLRLEERNPYFDARETHKNLLSGCALSCASVFNVQKIVDRLRLQDKRRPEERARLVRVAAEQSQGARSRLGAVLSELAALEREGPDDGGGEGEDSKEAQSGKELKDPSESATSKPESSRDATAEREAEHGQGRPAPGALVKSEAGRPADHGGPDKAREGLPEAPPAAASADRARGPPSSHVDGLPGPGSACDPQQEKTTSAPASDASSRVCSPGEGTGVSTRGFEEPPATKQAGDAAPSDRPSLAADGVLQKEASKEKGVDGDVGATQTFLDSTGSPQDGERLRNSVQRLPARAGPQEKAANTGLTPDGDQRQCAVEGCPSSDKEGGNEDGFAAGGDPAAAAELRGAASAPDREKQLAEALTGDPQREAPASSPGTAGPPSLRTEGTEIGGEHTLEDARGPLASPHEVAEGPGEAAPGQPPASSCPSLAVSVRDCTQGGKKPTASPYSLLVKTEEDCAKDSPRQDEGGKESATPTPRASPSTSRGVGARGSVGERQLEAKRVCASYATRRAQKRKRLELLSSSCEEIEKRLRRLSDTFPWLPVLNEAFFSAESKGGIRGPPGVHGLDDGAFREGAKADGQFASRLCGAAGVFETMGRGLDGALKDASIPSEGDESEDPDESEEDEEASLVPEDLWRARAAALAAAKAEQRALSDARAAAAAASAAAATAVAQSSRPCVMEPFRQASQRPFLATPAAMLPPGAVDSGTLASANGVRGHASPVPFSPCLGARASGVPEETEGSLAGSRRSSASTQSSRKRKGAFLDVPLADPMPGNQSLPSSAGSRGSFWAGRETPQGDVWAGWPAGGPLAADAWILASTAGGVQSQDPLRSMKRVAGHGTDKSTFWSGAGAAESCPGGELGPGASWGSGAEAAGGDRSPRGKGAVGHAGGRRQKASAGPSQTSGERDRRRSSVASSVTSSVSATRGGSGLPASGRRGECAGSVEMLEGSDAASEATSRSSSILMGPPSPLRPTCQYNPAGAYPSSPARSHASSHASAFQTHASREGGSETRASWQSLQHAPVGGTGNPMAADASGAPGDERAFSYAEEGDRVGARSVAVGGPPSANGGGRSRLVGSTPAQPRGYPAHPFAAHASGFGASPAALPSNYGDVDGLPTGLPFPGTPAAGSATPLQGGYPVSDPSAGGSSSRAGGMGFSGMLTPGHGPETPHMSGRMANFSPFFSGDRGHAAGDHAQLVKGSPSTPSAPGMQVQSGPSLSPWVDQNSSQHTGGSSVHPELEGFGAPDDLSSKQASMAPLGAAHLADHRQPYAFHGGGNVNLAAIGPDPLQGKDALPDHPTRVRDVAGAKTGASAGEGKAPRKRKPKAKKEEKGHPAAGDQIVSQRGPQEANACSSVADVAPPSVSPQKTVSGRGEAGGYDHSACPQAREGGGEKSWSKDSPSNPDVSVAPSVGSQASCSPCNLSPARVSAGGTAGAEVGSGSPAVPMPEDTHDAQRKTPIEKKRRSKRGSENRGACGPSPTGESDGSGRFWRAAPAEGAAATPSRRKAPPGTVSGSKT
ncbi:conserved hypothetical protein [Neospora caninum Liverpool]|uniref:Uncharacterized protein n=1 Tax=Neospora caninum (strain Liverpool) TaxID=572307 RepID=F0VEM3_NEOCL|nr:conserved hypothetical protein [Neospora caninum Liverpool]CBZ52167.1 conserved hypothetical protein [Neospora caninum Liverpool]CEL66133.1 TPA: hypothetical protein BN1204_019560 [Neospora caninum Liverpool]|eukprot:XP_003882199.1 conserved hypothetical protein [Neospora caninum Liverpool]